MHEIVAYYYPLVLVCIGTGMIGCVAGMIGSWVVILKKSLLGDMIAHATLPGMALVFLWFQTRSLGLLLLGGYGTALVALGLEYLLVTTTFLPYDAILGTLLSVFFGLGLVIITYAQRQVVGHHALLQKLVFGNAALLSSSDIFIMLGVGFFVLLLMRVMWRKIVAFAFDKQHFSAQKGSLVQMNFVMLLLFVTVIVTGLQTMGAILMGTLLVAPATAVRPWVSSATALVWYAGLWGALAAMGGSLISCVGERIPTGPMIVILVTIGTLVSLLCHALVQRFHRSHYGTAV